MVTRETSLSSGLLSLGVVAPAEFRETLARLEHLVTLLTDEAIPRGYVGEGEHGRIVTRHVLESAALLPLIASGPVIDVGSGAGLPGLVLACVISGVVLIEPMAKRAAFLRRASAELAVGAQVVQTTGEEAGRAELRESAPTVVARALAPPAVALELTLPLARLGGTVLLPVGAPNLSEGEDLEGTARPVSRDRADSGGGGELSGAAGSPAVSRTLAGAAGELGGAPPVLRRLAVPGVKGARWVMLVRKIGPTPERYPRRPGVPRRRPLGSRVS